MVSQDKLTSVTGPTADYERQSKCIVYKLKSIFIIISRLLNFQHSTLIQKVNDRYRIHIFFDGGSTLAMLGVLY